MLNLETRMEILGITVFQDADRPNQFYYLPGSPHISHERGEPLFDLFSYRRGGEAGQTLSGGFLNMTVDIGVGSLKDRIQRRLQEQYGDDATLAAVPFTKGTVRVIALGEDSKALQGGVENETTPSGDPLVARGPRFIQNILGAGRPSLDGDNRAIFSFSLSEDGSAFFLGLLSGNVNARPVGVVYELDYVGLLPAYDLEITIDFKSSYEYSRSRFTLGTLLFKADVDNIVEELRRRESIKIREVSRTLELSTPEAVRERQNRIDQLVKDLATGALFQPSLVPGQPRVQGDTITAADPTTSVPATPGTTASAAASALRNGPAAAVAAGMGEAFGASASASPRPPGAAGTSGTTGTTGAGTTGTSATGATGTGTSGAGTTATSGTGSAAGTGTTGQQPTSAGDLWNRLGRPQAAYVLKNIRQEEQRTVTYNMSQVTAQNQTIAPQGFIQFLASPRDLNRHVHVVDLNHSFFQRINLNINAADVDFAAEGITQMTVQLRYGTRPDGTRPKDTAEVILRSREDSRDFTFFADSKLTQDYEYKLLVDYQNDFGIGVHDTRVESPWIRSEARSLSVHPSWLGRTLTVLVQLAPNLPDDVTEVHARVRYANAARGIDDSVLLRLNDQNRDQTVHIRLADANEQFEVARTLFYGDGSSEELPLLLVPDPTSGSSDDAVVISAPAANRLIADVIMQDPLGELTSVLVDTQVLQGGTVLDSRTVELSSPGWNQLLAVRLPQRDQPATLRYRERRIFRDGGLEVEEWREPTGPNLVVGIRSEGTLAVTINYLGTKPSDLGLSAILVDLEYSDPAGDPQFNQKETLLITDDPASHTQDWKIRLPDRQANTYRWRLTLLHTDGRETSTAFNTDTRDRLILRPPQL